MSTYSNQLQPALQNLLQRVVRFFHPRSSCTTACMTISGVRTKQLDIFCRVAGFTSDFLSFIVSWNLFGSSIVLVTAALELKLASESRARNHWATLATYNKWNCCCWHSIGQQKAGKQTERTDWQQIEYRQKGDAWSSQKTITTNMYWHLLDPVDCSNWWRITIGNRIVMT